MSRHSRQALKYIFSIDDEKCLENEDVRAHSEAIPHNVSKGTKPVEQTMHETIREGGGGGETREDVSSSTSGRSVPPHMRLVHQSLAC